MQYVIGVDGGGTKTRAVVTMEGNRVVGAGSAGASNDRSVSGAEASDHLVQAIRAALVSASVSLEDIAGICMCLSGFDTELDLPVPNRAIAELGFQGIVILENDVIGAWAGATEAGPGIVVIGGTGSTALGMNRQGEFWRTDGWDYILGDAGGAYAIGLAGLRLAMKMVDGRLAPTSLLMRLHEAYGVINGQGMRRRVDGGPFGKMEIAGFAEYVSRAARDGDAIAQSLLRQAGVELGNDAVAIVRMLRMEDDTFPVCTVGGVFQSVPWVPDAFWGIVQPIAPRSTMTQPLHSPDVGAAILGRRRLESGDVGSWTLGTGTRAIRRSMDILEVSAHSAQPPSGMAQTGDPESLQSNLKTKDARSGQRFGWRWIRDRR